MDLAPDVVTLPTPGPASAGPGGASPHDAGSVSRGSRRSPRRRAPSVSGDARASMVAVTGSDTPTATGAPTIPTEDRDWIDALRGDGPGHHAAVRRLHDTVHRAAAHQVRRMPHVWSQLGTVRAQEIIDAAADEATTAVLGSLDRFEGRSRFSTWVFKFGILHAGTEARRALWRDRPVDLTEHPEPATGDHDGSASVVEARDLAAAVSTAIDTVLTARQRRVAIALIVDEVPIDVLAERMGTNRNALYKALHDIRVKLRSEMREQGYIHDEHRR